MKSGALSRVLQVKDSVGAAPESQTQLSRGRYTWYAFSQQRGMCYVYATELDYDNDFMDNAVMLPLCPCHDT
jgi:hypothetical protein